MGSEVKFRYGDNIKGLADSKKEQGTFYYDKSNQRLYLYTPSGASDSATLIPIGQSIIKVSSTSAISTYDDNAFYLDDNGNLYYYNSTINIVPQQIARLSDIEQTSSSTNESIVTINNQLNTIQSDITNIKKEIGDPKVTGGTNATGLYIYLDNLEANKVDNTVFESYKTTQANEFEAYKNEADAKFLSADEDLFLVSGNLKYGKLENGEWTDDESGKPYIVLVLKNNNDGNIDNNTIYIPAEDLVDVYTVTDTDTVDMTLTGLDIKADVKTENLINSTDTDTVTLSIDNNKIKTGFNTSNIIVSAKDSDTVNLSVINNQIAAAVNTSNIVDEDTLEIGTDNLISVNIKRLIENQDNAQVLLKYSTNDDALYAELSDSVKTTLNNANTTGNLINKNSEAIDANKTLIEANKAEFNTYKEEHTTEFSAYKETIGAYSYSKDKIESSGYFEQVQNHIDASMTATTTALVAEEKARQEADTTLQGNIDSVSSALDTERSRAQSEEAKLQVNIDAIYKINDNNIAEGILAQEITRSTAADATLIENLNTEIQNRENGDATLQGEIETLIDDVAEDFNAVNARIDAIYLKDGNATATGLLADEITRSVQADAELDAKIDSTNQNLSNVIGTYAYTPANDSADAIVDVVAGTYFAEVKKHIESEAAEIRAEFAQVDEDLHTDIINVDTELKNRISANASNISSVDNRVTELYSTTTNDTGEIIATSGIIDSAIKQVQANLESESSELNSLINSKDSQINTKIDSLYKVEEIASEDGTTSTSITGTIHNSIVSVSEQLSSKANELEGTDRELQEQITANKTAHEGYVAFNNEALAGEISNRERAISTIGAYTYHPAEEAQGENPGQEAYYEATDGTYFGAVKKHIDEEIAERIAADIALNTLVEANASAINTINTTTIPDVIKTVSENSNNISEIKDVTIPGINKAISDIGTYTYQEKTDNTDAKATVVEDTYFAEVKKHIESEAAEIRAEFAAADGVLSSRLDTTDNNITNEIKKVEELVAKEAKSREDNDKTLVARLDNLYTAKTDAAAASGLVENNRLAIEVINSTTIPQAEEKISGNKTNITNLKTAYDAAIVVKEGVLSSGQVKAYIDSQDNKLSEEIQNIVSNNTAGVYQTKTDANIRFTSTTVGDTTTYSGTIVDAYKAADEVLNNKFNNYYTIEEAEGKFLSANEDLFLVGGAVKTGSLSNGQWQDDENGDAYIYLELKNNNDTGTDVNALYIPANELVDTYEANNANESSVEVTVSNYQISADLSSTTKGNIKQGTDAYSAVSNSSTGLAAAHTAINDIKTSLTSNIGTYSYSDNTASATGNYFEAVKSHIEAIKSYSDDEDAELKKLIDANIDNIKINTDRLAAIGKFTSATETGYGGELQILYEALNSKLTGDIGTAVSALETGTVANNATNINNINTKLSAYGINDKSNDIYSLGDGVLKTYIDGNYNANLEAINANAKLIANIGAATGSEASFTSSGYLQTLYTQTVEDNKTLSSTLIGSTDDTSNSNTIYGAKKYSDANKAAAISEAQNKADAAAKTVYNTYATAGTTDTQYPILGGAQQTQSGNTQAVSYSGATISAAGYVRGNKVYGSVWNDYAEYRQTHHKVRPGQCVYEKGDGSLAISYERMMPGANIVSDTFGFAIGETDECKTPLAVSGRVLAYPYESKETYNPGDAVCSGPNGTISKMTRAEIRDYPERIVGTVSEIPTYEVWGSGNIKVNGRIWIKVR